MNTFLNIESIVAQAVAAVAVIVAIVVGALYGAQTSELARVKVIGTDGAPVTQCDVHLNGDTRENAQLTNLSGVAQLWLPSGDQKVRVTCPGQDAQVIDVKGVNGSSQLVAQLK